MSAVKTIKLDVGETTVKCSNYENEIHEKRIVLDRERVNIEPHQLVWLDPTVNKNEESNSVITLKALRKIVDYTKLFDDVEQCQQFIEQTKNTTSFLVTCGHLGERLVPGIHNLKRVSSIYIYCTNKEYHQKWASNYSKIKQVHTNIDELLNDLVQAVQEYLNHKKHEICGEIGRQDDTTDAFTCLLVEIVDLLSYLPYPDDRKCKLIDSLKYYYSGNEAQLKVLQEFERDYTSDKAIWWYTRDSFLYRSINLALQQHNIQVLFLFGFFIQDMYRQLKHEHEGFKLQHLDNPLKVYRGQFMTRDEIDRIKSCDYDTASSIVSNCFFSTTTARSVALLYTSTSQPDDGVQCVLFEIEIDVRLESRPYANISHLSSFPEESEVLFMTTTQFDIEPDDVYYNENEKVWIAKLKLLKDDHIKDDRDFENASKRKTLKNCVSILHDVLYKEQSDVRITIFNKLIDLFPSEKWIFDMKDHYLGYYPTKYIEETYAEALSTRDEVLTLWFEYINDDELNCSVDIGKIYKGIGDCYPEELNDHTMAIKHYDLAIDYFQLANQKATTDYEKIDIFDLLRDVYTSKMEISIDESEQIQNCLMAITHIELSVQNLLKYRSSDYYGIATRIEEIANLYQSIFKYDDALINYEKALEVYMQQFKPVLYRIKVTFEKIFKICYDHKHDYSSALKYQLMEHEYVLKHNARKPTDNMTEMCAKREEIVKSHIKLANVYITLHQYSLAEEHLMIIKKLYQESELPSQGKVEFIEEKLGNLYTRLHKHDLADKHLAMEKNLYQKTKNPLAELHIRHPIGYLAQKQKCAFFRFK